MGLSGSTNGRHPRLVLPIGYFIVGVAWFVGVALVIPILTGDVGPHQVLEDAGDVTLFFVGAAFLGIYGLRYRASVDRATEVQQASQRRFRTMLEASPAAIVVIDETGTIVEANGRVEMILGQRRDELVGRRREDVLVVGPVPVPNGVEASSSSDRPVPTAPGALAAAGDSVVRRKDGSTFVAEITSTPIDFDEAPQTMLTIVDLSERQRVLDALRESEARFRQITESIRECFWLRDADTGALLYLSPAYEEIWGRPRSVDGPVAPPLIGLHPDDRDRVVAATLTARDAWDMPVEFRIIRPDGSIRWIRARRFPVTDASGAIRRMGGVAEDVTDEKALVMRLQQFEKMEAVGQFASGIVHDFENVLTAVRGFAEIIRGSSAADDPRKSDADEIVAATERANGLTRKLLAFTRQDAVDPRVVHLDEVIAGLTPLLQRLVTDAIDVRVSSPGHLRCVRVDPVQVEQILLNLAANARDAMPSGGVLTIEAADVSLTQEDASRCPGTTAGDYVLVTVTDNGSGMDPATMARAFEPFFTTKAARGTGLGLATVYGIVQQSGGHVELSSEPGHGTTVRLYFPSVDSACDGPTVWAERPAVGG